MKILSFGETLWDIFSGEECLGGAPLNFAAFVAMFDEKSYLLSAVGADDLGRRAVEECRKIGINTEYITVNPDKLTGRCLVILDEKSIPSYQLINDVAFDYIQTPNLTEEYDVLSFGTLSLRSEYNRRTLDNILEKYSFGEIFCDVNIRPPFYSKESIEYCLSNATIIKISVEELHVIKDAVSISSSSDEDVARELSEQFKQLKVIIITKGADGAFCYDCAANVSYNCMAESVEVVSTVGAGDSFGASFLVSYLKGKGYDECLECASRISGYVCSKKEAVPPDAVNFINKLQAV